MSSIGTVYGSPSHGLVKRVLAVAAFGNVKIDTVEGYTHFQDNKKPEFLAKFPAGKIPAFIGTDGFVVTETSAVVKYVASKSTKADQLLGKTPEEKALVDQWLSFATSEIQTNVSYVNRLMNSVIPYNKPLHTYVTDNHLRALAVVEKHLASHTFLVNERITAADILLAQIVQMATTLTLGKEERAKFPNVLRHFETISNQPEIKPVFGENAFVDKPAVFTPPKKEKAPADAKPKAEKPKAEPKPKAEKKPKDDEDDDEPLVPEEPKAKNPLDDLPKSTLNLEDWKRAYSNMETRGDGGAIEWFYKNFDPAGYSLWRVDFKYNEELTQTFMSSNQIGGFFNRLEASRKYLFGSLGVLGKPNDSIIAGVFIARGPDIAPVVTVAPDWESYSYEAISLDNEEQKKFFEAALAWDLEIDGKAWADGKNFK